MTDGKFIAELQRGDFQLQSSSYPFPLCCSRNVSTGRMSAVSDDPAITEGSSLVEISRRVVSSTQLEYHVQGNESIDNRQQSHASRHHQVCSPGKIAVITTGILDATKNRALVQHNYHDHAFREDAFSVLPVKIDEELKMLKPDSQSLDNKQTSGRQGLLWKNDFNSTFPEKLYGVLKLAATDDSVKSVISWQPHGRCFLVHDQVKFVNQVLMRYFRQSKYTSFQRQLNLYGFKRLTRGPDVGAYYHELFLRGRQGLCRRIVRMRIKGNGIKPAPNPRMEPNFYKMKPCFESDAADVPSEMEAIQQFPSKMKKSVVCQFSSCRESLEDEHPSPLETTPSEATSVCTANRNSLTSLSCIIPTSQLRMIDAVSSTRDAFRSSVGETNISLSSSETPNIADSGGLLLRNQLDPVRENKVLSPTIMDNRDDEDPLLDADVAAVDPWIMQAFESRFLPVGNSRKRRMSREGWSLYSSTTISSLQLLDDLQWPLGTEPDFTVDEGSLLRLLSTEL